MKKYNIGSAVLVSLLMAGTLAMTVSANSSWVWISESRPYDLLPAVVAITLAGEVYALYHFAGVRKLGKVFFWVTVANLLSFLAPYALGFLADRAVHPGFQQFLDSGPHYSVGGMYLALTLLVETPVVLAALHKEAAEDMGLLKVIVLTNVVTTALVALIERVFYEGHW